MQIFQELCPFFTTNFERNAFSIDNRVIYILLIIILHKEIVIIKKLVHKKKDKQIFSLFKIELLSKQKLIDIDNFIKILSHITGRY